MKSQTYPKIAAISALLIFLISAPAILSDEVQLPVYLSIETGPIETPLSKAKGWSQSGFPTNFAIDEVYSMTLGASVVPVEMTKQLLLEVKLYENEKLICSPTFLVDDGAVTTYTISNSARSRSPAAAESIEKAAAALSQIRIVASTM